MSTKQTTPEENTALVRRMVDEVQEKADFSLIDQLMHPDFYNHTAYGGLPVDKSGVLATMTLLHEVFKDIKMEVIHCVCQGNVVATNKVLRGRQVGEWMGQPGTGKMMELGIMDFVTVEDGKIKEHWARAGPMVPLE